MANCQRLLVQLTNLSLSRNFNNCWLQSLCWVDASSKEITQGDFRAQTLRLFFCSKYFVQRFTEEWKNEYFLSMYFCMYVCTFLCVYICMLSSSLYSFYSWWGIVPLNIWFESILFIIADCHNLRPTIVKLSLFDLLVWWVQRKSLY
jgi:hypothetical protein